MNKKQQQFCLEVKNFWKDHGRHTLPWRQSVDPYRILVSEVMLQQTQVDRVLPKYQAFVKKWGSARALARAPLAEVLAAWQGLGYNSRAKRLHDCARSVVADYKNIFPDTFEGLQKLPGIGPYTAGAVLAFVFNKPVPIIETNIRTVYIHHFFPHATDISEPELMQIIADTLDTKNVREWYWALMDYGAHLKKTHGNPNYRSRNHTRQSRFEGSDRQIRGAIIRILTKKPCTRSTLHKVLPAFDDLRIDAQLERLSGEGLVTKCGQHYSLPD